MYSVREERSYSVFICLNVKINHSIMNNTFGLIKLIEKIKVTKIEGQYV